MQESAKQSIKVEDWQEWQIIGRRAQLVDVRSATEFATAHLPGAINIPLEQIELRTADLEKNVPIVLVCQAGIRAALARDFLAGRDMELMVLEGGTDAWVKAGRPVIRNTIARWALERQVRFAAGALVLTGVLLSVVLSPWWLVVSGFVGCGLIFAGVTNLCLMGELLARMSWNRPIKHSHSPVASPVPEGVFCACKLEDRKQV